jgi:hypothetical protein
MLDDDLLTLHVLVFIKGGENDQDCTDGAEKYGIRIILEKYGQQYGGNEPSVKDAEVWVEVLQYGRADGHDDAENKYVE